MTRVIGITESAADDWRLTTIGWIFSIVLCVLGLSSATFGRWVVREGLRKAMFWSAVFFSVGFILSSIGIFTHQFWTIALIPLIWGLIHTIEKPIVFFK